MVHVLTDFSAPALIKAIEDNHTEYMLDLRRSPQVALRHDPEITWFVTSFPLAGFNRVLQARFDAGDIDAKIEAVLGLYRSRGLPLLWHIGPSTRPADLAQRLIAHGFICTANEPGMAGDLLALEDDPPLPHGLTVQHVSDVETLWEWCLAFKLASGTSSTVSETLFRIEASLGPGQNPARRLYIGFMREKPVATSLVFLGAGVAGLYSVATTPELRQQGIGRAMTLVPLLEARAMGYRIGTLHATEMGLRVYHRLGFQEYCRLSRYLCGGRWDAQG